MLDLEVLSTRERDILWLLARGLRNKEIAREAGLAEGTIRVHVHAIFQKTGIRTRAAVAAAAAHLVQPASSAPRDLVALVRRVATDVVRITAAEDAGHLTPPEAHRLIGDLVAVGA